MGEGEAGIWERERREYGRGEAGIWERERERKEYVRGRGRNMGEGEAEIWERERQDYLPD